MYIQDSLVDFIISQIRVEYGGCHAPNNSEPLYGRAAYWRVYLPSGAYVCKVTTPVKTLNPKEATLAKLFRAELKKRLQAIDSSLSFDHYGAVEFRARDPYSVMALVELVKGQYPDLVARASA